ncbi:AbrB/MazE/SpoVT family DNA-binding domain-containing protein [Candidatus Peribacteria bacterium]|nr:AbrB/MazE/SpoVT family DNA-binding domain-containing protein [Candidatus Peribacteria bacterium]
MVYATLSVQKTGMITLPKKWRDQHPVNTVIAEFTNDGLLIRPLDEIEFYENKTHVGLHFPNGIEAGRLATMFEMAMKKIDAEDAASAKSKKKSRTRR